MYKDTYSWLLFWKSKNSRMKYQSNIPNVVFANWRHWLCFVLHALQKVLHTTCFEKVLVCFPCDYCACLFFCLPNLLSGLDGCLHPREKHNCPMGTFLKSWWEQKMEGRLMHSQVRSSSLLCWKLVVQGWVTSHLPLSEFFLLRIVKRFPRSSGSMLNLLVSSKGLSKRSRSLQSISEPPGLTESLARPSLILSSKFSKSSGRKPGLSRHPP